MKKRFLGIIMAVLMSVTCFAVFSGCFGGGSTLHTINEAEWQDYFDEVNFQMRGYRYNGYFTKAKNSYSVNSIEYGKNLEFKGQSYDYYKVEDSKVSSIEASEYVDYSESCAPFFTFMHDNFNNFTLNQPEDDAMQIYIYDGELSADIKESIVNMMKLACSNESLKESVSYDYHSIVVVANYQYIKDLFIMDGDYEITMEDIYHTGSMVARISEIGESEDYQAVNSIIYQEKEAMLYVKIEDSIKSVSNCFGENVNFVVKGGKGVDYQELYFTDKGMRFYTPNATQPQIYGDSNVYIDGIYYNDNGTFKYYKKTKEGVWSFKFIEEEQFVTTIATMYNIYCGGGKWLTAESIKMTGFDFSTSTLGHYYESTDTTTFKPYYDGRFYKVKYTFDSNDMLQKVTWKLEMIPTSLGEQLGGKKLTYDYTLTVGGASFTIPSVQK